MKKCHKHFLSFAHHLAAIVSYSQKKREINKKISLYFLSSSLVLLPRSLVVDAVAVVAAVGLLLPQSATSYNLQHKEQHLHKGFKWVCCMTGVGVGRPLINQMLVVCCCCCCAVFLQRKSACCETCSFVGLQVQKNYVWVDSINQFIFLFTWQTVKNPTVVSLNPILNLILKERCLFVK